MTMISKEAGSLSSKRNFNVKENKKIKKKQQKEENKKKNKNSVGKKEKKNKNKGSNQRDGSNQKKKKEILGDSFYVSVMGYRSKSKGFFVDTTRIGSESPLVADFNSNEIFKPNCLYCPTWMLFAPVRPSNWEVFYEALEEIKIKTLVYRIDQSSVFLNCEGITKVILEKKIDFAGVKVFSWFQHILKSIETLFGHKCAGICEATVKPKVAEWNKKRLEHYHKQKSRVTVHSGGPCTALGFDPRYDKVGTFPERLINAFIVSAFTQIEASDRSLKSWQMIFKDCVGIIAFRKAPRNVKMRMDFVQLITKYGESILRTIRIWCLDTFKTPHHCVHVRSMVRTRLDELYPHMADNDVEKIVIQDRIAKSADWIKSQKSKKREEVKQYLQKEKAKKVKNKQNLKRNRKVRGGKQRSKDVIGNSPVVATVERRANAGLKSLNIESKDFDVEKILRRKRAKNQDGSKMFVTKFSKEHVTRAKGLHYKFVANNTMVEVAHGLSKTSVRKQKGSGKGNSDTDFASIKPTLTELVATEKEFVLQEPDESFDPWGEEEERQQQLQDLDELFGSDKRVIGDDSVKKKGKISLKKSKIQERKAKRQEKYHQEQIYELNVVGRFVLMFALWLASLVVFKVYFLVMWAAVYRVSMWISSWIVGALEEAKRVYEEQRDFRLNELELHSPLAHFMWWCIIVLFFAVSGFLMELFTFPINSWVARFVDRSFDVGADAHVSGANFVYKLRLQYLMRQVVLWLYPDCRQPRDEAEYCLPQDRHRRIGEREPPRFNIVRQQVQHMLDEALLLAEEERKARLKAEEERKKARSKDSEDEAQLSFVGNLILRWFIHFSNMIVVTIVAWILINYGMHIQSYLERRFRAFWGWLYRGTERRVRNMIMVVNQWMPWARNRIDPGIDLQLSVLTPGSLIGRFIVVVIEEGIKRVVPFGTALIIVVEYSAKWYSFKKINSIMLMLLTLAHIPLWYLPFWLAVLCHFAWNVFCARRENRLSFLYWKWSTVGAWIKYYTMRASYYLFAIVFWISVPLTSFFAKSATYAFGPASVAVVSESYEYFKRRWRVNDSDSVFKKNLMVLGKHAETIFSVCQETDTTLAFASHIMFVVFWLCAKREIKTRHTAMYGMLAIYSQVMYKDVMQVWNKLDERKKMLWEMKRPDELAAYEKELKDKVIDAVQKKYKKELEAATANILAEKILEQSPEQIETIREMMHFEIEQQAAFESAWTFIVKCFGLSMIPMSALFPRSMLVSAFTRNVVRNGKEGFSATVENLLSILPKWSQEALSFLQDPFSAEVKKLMKIAEERGYIAHVAKATEQAGGDTEFAKEFLGFWTKLTNAANHAAVYKKSIPWASLRDLRRIMEPIYFQSHARVHQEHQRVTPCGIMLFGPSASGKSRFIAELYRLYCDITGRPFSKASIYARSTATEYWDTFPSGLVEVTLQDLDGTPRLKDGQEQKAFFPTCGVCVWDDYNIESDPLKNGQICGEMMHCINSWPYALNCAHLEQKGTKFFDASLAIATANVQNRSKEPGVRDHIAFRRRWPFMVEVHSVFAWNAVATGKSAPSVSSSILMDYSGLDMNTRETQERFARAAKQVEIREREKRNTGEEGDYIEIPADAREFPTPTPQELAEDPWKFYVVRLRRCHDLEPTNFVFSGVQFKSIMGRVFKHWSFLCGEDFRCPPPDEEILEIWNTVMGHFPQMQRSAANYLGELPPRALICRAAAEYPEQNEDNAVELQPVPFAYRSWLWTLIGLILVGVVYKAYKWFTKSERLEYQSEPTIGAGSSMAVVRKRVGDTRALRLYDRPSKEGPNNRVLDNIATLCVQLDIEGEVEPVCQCLLIDDRHAVTVAHAIYGNGITHLRYHGVDIPLGNSKARPVAGRDLAILIFDKPIQGVKGISAKLFRKEEECKKMLSCLQNQRIVRFVKDRDTGMIWPTYVRWEGEYSDDWEVRPTKSMKFWAVQTVQKTKRGDCGSPYLVNDETWQAQETVIGIHCAALENYTYCTPVFKEDLEFKELQDMTWEEVLVQEFGAIRVKQASRLPNRTKLLETELCVEVQKVLEQRETPLQYGPALLSTPDRPTPLENGVKRMQCFTKAIPLPTEFILQAWSYLDRNLPMYDLEDEHVILNGDPVRGIDGLKMNKSAGYPASVKGLKKQHFCTGTADMGNLKMCWERLESVFGTPTEESILHYIPVCATCLKDETVSLKKIANRKTRMFWCAPLPMVYVGRKVMCARQAASIKDRGHHHCMLGVDCHSREWGMLWDWVTNGRRNIMCGDYETYDLKSSHSLYILLSEYDLMNCTKRARPWMHWYRRYSTCTVREVAGYIFTTLGGNISGKIGTTSDNDKVNFGYLLTAFWILYERQFGSQPLVEDFFTICRTATFGDDHIVGVHPEHTWFNMITYAEVCRDMFGMKYTDANKVDPVEPYVEYKDVTFLKRHFIVDVDHVWAPLAEEKLVVQLCYMSKGGTLQQNIDSFLRELAHHDNETVGFWLVTLKELAVKVRNGVHITPSLVYDTRLAIVHSAGV